MSVDRNGWVSERGIEDDVRGLPSDAGKCFEFFSSLRDFAIKRFKQNCAGFEDVLGFRVE